MWWFFEVHCLYYHMFRATPTVHVIEPMNFDPTVSRCSSPPKTAVAAGLFGAEPRGCIGVDAWDDGLASLPCGLNHLRSGAFFWSWGTIKLPSNICGDSWKKINSCYETNSCYKQISTKNSWLLFGLVLISVRTVSSSHPKGPSLPGPKAAERLRELSQDLQRQVLDKGDLRCPLSERPGQGLCQLRGDPQVDSPTGYPPVN